MNDKENKSSEFGVQRSEFSDGSLTAESRIRLRQGFRLRQDYGATRWRDKWEWIGERDEKDGQGPKGRKGGKGGRSCGALTALGGLGSISRGCTPGYHMAGFQPFPDAGVAATRVIRSNKVTQGNLRLGQGGLEPGQGN